MRVVDQVRMDAPSTREKGKNQPPAQPEWTSRPAPGQKAGARGERRLTAFPILQFGASRFPQAHVDLLVYVGDLAPLFGAAASALTSDGLFAFSVESCDPFS